MHCVRFIQKKEKNLIEHRRKEKLCDNHPMDTSRKVPVFCHSWGFGVICDTKQSKLSPVESKTFKERKCRHIKYDHITANKSQQNTQNKCLLLTDKTKQFLYYRLLTFLSGPVSALSLNRSDLLSSVIPFCFGLLTASFNRSSKRMEVLASSHYRLGIACLDITLLVPKQEVCVQTRVRELGR